jgi:glyoxylase-like metal-dependent hydrolase (beta-lactamase superfamily II)
MWDWEHPPLPIQRIEVPNSGFMRDQPTNSYILGNERVVIVDPGSEPGVELISRALLERGSPEVAGIFLTHAHPDHAIAAPDIRRVLNAPLMLHGDNDPIMNDHISWDDVDVRIDPETSLTIEDMTFELVMTPGHAPGHVALFDRRSQIMIAGDLVSGHGTIGVFPPNGSMTEYIDSLRRAKALEPAILLPGHGPVIDDADGLFEHYIARRLGREREIIDIVGEGGATINDILPVLYPDLLPEYSYPAEATILAHLQKLQHEGQVEHHGGDPKTATWIRA